MWKQPRPKELALINQELFRHSLRLPVVSDTSFILSHAKADDLAVVIPPPASSWHQATLIPCINRQSRTLYMSVLLITADDKPEEGGDDLPRTGIHFIHIASLTWTEMLMLIISRLPKMRTQGLLLLRELIGGARRVE
ncbi:hypothetical protein RJT34_17968 [Clitoria ternatea]|uniref:Uncharacterized protein n=1 Tax=Clitoria ternatea TaxID=43366 RepID=A0AAN9J9W7_CLITE